MKGAELAEKTMELYCMHADAWEDVVCDHDACGFMDHAYQEYMQAGETVPGNWDTATIDKVNENHQALWDIHSRVYGAKRWESYDDIHAKFAADVFKEEEE